MSFFACLIYDYYKKQQKTKKIDVATQVDSDDIAWTNVAECRNCVELRVDATRRAVQDQSVQTDTDVRQRVPVTKRKKLTAKRIEKNMERLILYHSTKREYVRKSEVHGQPDGMTVGEERDVIEVPLQPYNEKDVVMVPSSIVPVVDGASPTEL